MSNPEAFSFHLEVDGKELEIINPNYLTLTKPVPDDQVSLWCKFISEAIPEAPKASKIKKDFDKKSKYEVHQILRNVWNTIVVPMHRKG